MKLAAKHRMIWIQQSSRSFQKQLLLIKSLIFLALSGLVWVFRSIRDEGCQDFEAQILLILDSVSPALNDPDLVVESLYKAEGNFVVGMAVTDHAVPVPLNQGGEFFKRL